VSDYARRELMLIKNEEDKAWKYVSHALAWNDFNELDAAYRRLCKVKLKVEVFNKIIKREDNKLKYSDVSK
jgi:hypothetical protein